MPPFTGDSSREVRSDEAHLFELMWPLEVMTGIQIPDGALETPRFLPF